MCVCVCVCVYNQANIAYNVFPIWAIHFKQANL